MVDAVGVADQGVGQAAQVQQAVPVGVVAGQARDFQAQHDAGLAQRNLGRQSREAGPLGAGGTGATQILVNDFHLIGGQPSERARSASSYWRRVDSRLRCTCV